MTNRASKRIEEALDNHSERLSVVEMAKAGRRHVRTMSRSRFLELIEEIVDETIAAEVGEVTRNDRDRVVEQARLRLDGIAAAQREAEQRQLEAEQLQAEAEQHQREAEQRRRDDDKRICERDEQIGRLNAELRDLRERIETADAGRNQEQAIESLIRELTEWRAGAGDDLEKRFDASLGRTLEAIDKTLRSAAHGPLDRHVEATDAVVGQVMDERPSMSSNTDRLSVAERTSHRRIDQSLEQLRTLRRSVLPQDPTAPTSDTPQVTDPEGG